MVQTYQNTAYLFFLAIDENSRSKGYGSRAIETLREEYPDKYTPLILKCWIKLHRTMSNVKKKKLLSA